jgi:hypothetical protein
MFPELHLLDPTVRFREIVDKRTTHTSHIYTDLMLCVTYRRVWDWMIGFIGTLFAQLESTGNTALMLICTLYS